MGGGEEPIADFHSVNAPTMANFKLPMWSHWTQNWEKMVMIGSHKLAPANHCWGFWNLRVGYTLSWNVKKESLIFPVPMPIISPRIHLHRHINSWKGSRIEDTQIGDWWTAPLPWLRTFYWNMSLKIIFCGTECIVYRKYFRKPESFYSSSTNYPLFSLVLKENNVQNRGNQTLFEGYFWGISKSGSLCREVTNFLLFPHPNTQASAQPCAKCPCLTIFS